MLRVKLVPMQDVVTIGKIPTAQLAMFVCAERLYGIAIVMLLLTLHRGFS